MNSASEPSKRASGSDRGAATVDRIIAAAERLFGTLGIEGASMRQIMLEAHVSNKSAVTYHFGDRHSLVTAIWRRRLPELETIRAGMLSRIVADGLGDDPHALAGVLFLPGYQLTDEEGRHRYLAFMGQALRWGPGRVIRTEIMSLSPSSEVARSRFRNVFPQIPDDIFTWRLRMATGLFVDAVADRDHAVADGEPVIAEDAFLRDVIRLAVACCAAGID